MNNQLYICSHTDRCTNERCSHKKPHIKSIGCIEDICYRMGLIVKCIQIFDDFITEEEFKI